MSYMEMNLIATVSSGKRNQEQEPLADVVLSPTELEIFLRYND